MSQVETKPGVVQGSVAECPLPTDLPKTTATVILLFDSVKELCSPRPLRRGIRRHLDDDADIQAARDALQDVERFSYDDVRRELGLS